MEQIATNPKAALEEKRKMMEMLRRFEDQEGEGLDGDHDEDEDELAEKLEGIDLGWCTSITQLIHR